ncbi:sugar phosphate isomerase/epimerase family protein [Paenibacillus sp. NPDC058071]|uniref:sugar phosphate isomerase/epimerase family protein n=1 Tax=Paenibacillus sp. NPDC058071 TaxID=3346326 RepID=UPI0036DC10B6
MKLSVFTVATPEFTPEQLAEAAASAGLSAIEWRYKEAPEGAESQAPSFWGNNLCTLLPSGGDAMVERLRQAAADHGLKSISLTPYLQAGDLEETEEVLRKAALIGASFIRLGVPAYDRTRPFHELFELERRYLREAEKLCAKYGVKGLIETHHQTISASASAAYRLCEGLNPDHIGVLFDPGNMVHEGFENFRMGIELLGPYLAHVHVKNAGWSIDGQLADGSAQWVSKWVGLKEGVVPWQQVIEDLQSVGYDGYLGIEDFSGQFSDSADMLNHFAAYMNELLQGK